MSDKTPEEIADGLSERQRLALADKPEWWRAHGHVRVIRSLPDGLVHDWRRGYESLTDLGYAVAVVLMRRAATK